MRHWILKFTLQFPKVIAVISAPLGLPWTPLDPFVLMKMNVQQGLPAPTSATMPWGPITAPALTGSP